MWMFSLGRALLDTTPRVAALTGTVSVSPPSALQSVLAAMTEPDPRRRASLMNLLDVSSQILIGCSHLILPNNNSPSSSNPSIIAYSLIFPFIDTIFLISTVK